MNSSTLPRLHDVIIAGAGPVGLFLACELALAHLDVLVLERADQPEAPLKAAPLGTRGLSVATAQAFHRRGLLAALQAASTAAGLPRAAQASHFAGIAIDPGKIDASRWTYLLAGPASGPLAATMQCVESVLAARALALGVEIRRGVAVDGLEDHGDAVDVHVGTESFHAKWLVGCDGGRSAVRRLAGFDFPGTEPEFTAYSALVDIADPQVLRPGRHATAGGFYMNQPGRIAIADFDGGAFDRSQPITREHLQAVLRRVSGTEVTLAAVHLATTFTDRARQASTYRIGRVLLAGDAAHIHSALGWKLAATLHGSAPDDLLATYQAERHPVGQWLLDWTRAQAAIMRPGAQARALEGVTRALADTRDGATWFAEQSWGISLRYDLGGSHPLAGRSAPDFGFADGSRLADHLCDGKAVLVDFGVPATLRPVIAPWSDRIRHVACNAGDELGLGALLVRPDGFVAWASAMPAGPGEIEQVATRWFGSLDWERMRNPHVHCAGRSDSLK